LGSTVGSLLTEKLSTSETSGQTNEKVTPVTPAATGETSLSAGQSRIRELSTAEETAGTPVIPPNWPRASQSRGTAWTNSVPIKAEPGAEPPKSRSMDGRSPNTLVSPPTMNGVAERLLPLVRTVSTQSCEEGGAHPVVARVCDAAPLSNDAEDSGETSLDGILDNPSADSDRLFSSVQAFSSTPEVEGNQPPTNQAKVTPVVAALNVIQVDHVSNGRQESEECPGLESPLCQSMFSDRCTPGSIMVQFSIVQCDNDNSVLAGTSSPRGEKNTLRRSNKAVGDGGRSTMLPPCVYSIQTSSGPPFASKLEQVLKDPNKCHLAEFRVARSIFRDPEDAIGRRGPHKVDDDESFFRRNRSNSKVWPTVLALL
jgi:hypothetical protein